MPGFGSTPETLLGRNDSKNPATTCRGMTSSGRPCRRALKSKAGLILPGRSRVGVVAVASDHDPEYYCWQHQDQAIQRAVQDNQQTTRLSTSSQRHAGTRLYPLKDQTGLEDLFEQLDLEDDQPSSIPNASQSHIRSPPDQRSSRQKTSSQTTATRKPTRPQPPKKQSKPPGFWSSLCCLTSSPDDDYIEIVRHRKRVARHTHVSSVETTQNPQVVISPWHHAQNTHPETRDLLSYIPTQLAPSTATLLLSELVKPISPTDEEGYIYIFWLTSDGRGRPDDGVAQSLLAAPETDHRGRRISDVLTEYSFDPTAHGAASSRRKRAVMLKIGRANNVTRRMNEWQRQCGYTLSLIRWYPYLANSSSQPNSALPNDPLQVRKVPCVRRVERLIHLELADAQVKRQCHTCGREHREWFEVEATQAGIRAVDDCIRRWVRWAETKSDAGMSTG